MKQIPLNTDKDGCCSCLKANYYKMGGVNFLSHTNDGFKATCIMEEKEPKAVSYTKDKEGKVENYHLNDIANTVHSSTGGGGNTDCYIAEPMCSVHPLSHAHEMSNNSIKPIAPALRATDYKAPHCVYEPQVLTPKRTEYGKAVCSQYENGELDISRHDMTTMEPRNDNISNTITTVQKDNVLIIPEATAKGYAEAYDGDSVNLALPNSKTRRGRVGHQQANTLDTSCNQGVVTNYRIRKLTPRECFRLMDVSETDIDKLLNAGISNTQLYKLAGNSICVGVLYHIFRKLFIEKENEHQQLTLF